MLAILTCMVMIPKVYAYNFESGGIYYDITSPNTVAVTYATGSYNSYSGTVDIPSTVTYNGTTYTVTAIGNSAFRNSSNLTGVTIPGTVTSIGESAFDQCYQLSSITIPNGIETIGGHAFDNCFGLTTLIFNAVNCSPTPTYNHNPDYRCDYYGDMFCGCYNVTTLIIGEEVQSIPDYAFLHFRSITSITIPNSVTYIGDGAFQDCYSLTSVNIGNAVSYIGNYAFSGCSGLSSLNIPGSVNSISTNSFSGCINLTSIIVSNGNPVYDSRDNCNAIVHTATNTLIYGCQNTVIPNTIDNIGDYAFSGCSTLSNMPVFPNSVKHIGQYAYKQCTGLTGTLTIPDHIKTIGASAFSGCNGLTSVVIGSAVDSIGYSAFGDCGINTVVFNADSCSYMASPFTNPFTNNSITSLTIGSNVKAIPNNAFKGLSILSSLTIPNSVQRIGDNAFSGCTSLTGTLFLPDSAKYIGNRAFASCFGITGVTIPNSVVYIGDSAFSNCSGIIGTLTIPNSISYLGSSAFSYCNISSVIYNVDSCASGGGSFKYCGKLKNLIIGNTVKILPFRIFAECDSLTGELFIPNSVKYIGEGAFSGCSSLTGSLIIPDSVVSIGSSAFCGCSSIDSLVIGKSVANIGRSAFSRCSSLLAVMYKADRCTYMGDYGNNNAENLVFYNCNLLSSLTIGDNVKYIPSYAFRNCNNLSGKLVIPDSVVTIGVYAFHGCSGIDTLVIGKSVVNISISAFGGCSGLTGNLVIPDSVVTISSYAFGGCSGIDTLVIGKSVVDIGNSSFSYCSGISFLLIGESVRTIGDLAFQNCTSLTHVTFNADSCTTMGSSDYTVFNSCGNFSSLTIGENVKNIPNYAFYGCSGLTGTLFIPNSVIIIEDNAFGNCNGLDTLIVGRGVRSIGGLAFSSLSGLTHVEFYADSCLFEGDFNNRPFKGCNNISSLIIGNNVKNIPNYAFYGLSNITGSLTIPDSVVSIGNYAFYGCSGYTSLSLGKSIANIGQRAFAGNISSIYSYRVIPPTIDKTAPYQSFYYVNRNTPVYVPCGSAQAYQNSWTYSTTNSNPYFYNIYESLQPYHLTAIPEDTLKGSVQITTQATCTTPAVIEAIPNFFYVFDHWSDGNTDNPRNVSLAQDSTLIAYFREYSMTINCDTAYGHIVVLQAPTAENPQAVIEVVPERCYLFSNWRDISQLGWTTGYNYENPRTITLTQDTTLAVGFGYAHPVTIIGGYYDNLCDGDTAVLKGYTYSTSTNSFTEGYLWLKRNWTGTTYAIDTLGMSDSILVTESGTYWVVGIDSSGCTAYDSRSITFHDYPLLIISGKTDVCEGDSAIITASSYGDYELNENFSEGIPSDWTVSNNNILQTYNLGGDHGTALLFPGYSLPSNTIEELILPNLDLSYFNSPRLTFNLAYRRYNSSSTEKLRVFMSTDDGSSWNEIYTSGSYSYINDPFYPTDYQWSAQSINLLNYLSNNTETEAIKLKFEFSGGQGNNMWVDNIHIYSYYSSYYNYPYYWSNGSSERQQVFNTPGTYQVTVSNSYCATTDSVTINVWQPSDTSEVTVNSTGSYYVMNGEAYCQSGDYTQTLQNIHGCDSVVNLHLTLTLDTTVVNDTIHGSYSYYEDDGTRVNYSGWKYSYQYPMTPNEYPHWADSVLAYQAAHPNWTQFALSYDSSTNLASKTYIYVGHSIRLPDNSYTGSSFYLQGDDVWENNTYYDVSDTLTRSSSVGCDSTIILNARIMYAEVQYVYLEECGRYIWQWDSIFIGGTTASGDTVLGFATGDTLTESVTCYQRLTNVSGCDSILYKYLTIHPAAYESVVESACESYTLNGTTYTESGVYTQHTDTTLVINRNLFWRSYNSCGYWNSWGLFTSYMPTGWSNLHSHYNYDDQWNVISVDYYFLDANGDTTYLDSANQVVVYVDTVNACKELTLNLTINHPVTESFEATACDSYTWNDSIYSQSGDYIQTFTSANGCDSVVTLHLTVNYSNTGDTSVVACDSFDWYEHIGITASGEYTHTFTNTSSCDSVVSLHLTVNTSDHTELTAAACGQYVWLDSTYTESGNYSVTYTNTAGCDSIVTLHLTINPIPDVAITGNTTICPGGGTMLTATGADTYMWSNYSTTASIPVNVFGVYSVTGTTSAGCTNTASVTVLVAQPPMITVTGDLDLCAGETGTITAHGGTTYMWSNGSTDSVLTVNATGTWQVIGYDENGCNSMTNVSVTVWQPVNTQYSVMVNDSCYIWNSISYCESGDYTQTFQTVHGCDSVVTLHLTFTTSIYADLYETACDSYTWNNATYGQSGDYMQSFVLPNGSDSIVTLHLTIYPSVSSDFTIVTEDSCYLWNNIEYCASGDYTQTFQTIHGCDSVVTLHLTITVGVDDHETVDFKVYPNPTNNIVNIECIMHDEELGEVELHLVDAYGRVLDVVEANNHSPLQTAQIDLSRYASGVYFVKLVAENKTIAVRKVVKK